MSCIFWKNASIMLFQAAGNAQSKSREKCADHRCGRQDIALPFRSAARFLLLDIRIVLFRWATGADRRRKATVLRAW
jgi:hypothetical protein